MSDMRWLFATMHDVSRAASGGSYASRAYFEALRTVLGSEVLVVAPEGSGSYFRSVGCAGVIECPARNWRQRLRGLLGHDRDRIGTTLDRVRPEVRGFTPRLAVVDGGLMGGGVARLKCWGIPIVSLHHNDESEYKRYATGSRLISWDARRVQRYVLRTSALGLVLTQRDAERLGATEPCAPPLRVIGYGEAARPAPSAALPRDCLRLSLTGNFGVAKGFSGLRVLAAYLRSAPATLPRHQVFVGGHNMGVDMRAFCTQAKFEITENDDALGRANVYVNPSEHPGGLKIRNCDGGRVGLPLLVHINSLPGFEMLADGAASYCSRLQFYEQLAALWGRISGGAYSRDALRQMYYREFSQEALIQRLRVVFSDQMPLRSDSTIVGT